MIEVRVIISDIHMGAGHKGLNEVIRHQKKLNTDTRKALSENGLAFFVNTARTAGKLYKEGGETLAYIRLKNGEFVSEKQVNKAAEEFGGNLRFSPLFRQQLKDLCLKEKRAKKQGRIITKKHPAPKNRAAKRDSDGRVEV